MDLKIFGVLMWKHWCVRKRRIIVTILEFFIPLILFILLFAFKNKLLDGYSTAMGTREYSSVQITEPVRLAEMSEQRSIIYTPNMDFTRDLMETVGKKLGLSEITELPGRGYYAFNHTSEIANFTLSDGMTEHDAVVIFKPGISDPENIEYTIRMKGNYYTQVSTSFDGRLSRHPNFGSQYETFMRLQWAIDTAFLEMRTRKQVKQDVTVQEFPYVESFSSPVAFLVASLLGFCIFFSLAITFTLLISRLAGERASGVQELMKMSGVSSGTLALGHFLDVLPSVLSFSLGGAILLTVGTPALLDNTNGFLLFLFLLLHSCTMVAFAFVCGYLLKSLEYVNTLSVTIFTALWLGSGALVENLPTGLQPLAGLVPAVPAKWLLRQLETLLQYGYGLTFRTMFDAHDAHVPSAATALLFLVLQTFIFMLLAWYLDHVCPGHLGLAMPWNFFCQKQYWRKNNVVPDEGVDEVEESMASERREEKYFEPTPADADVGIRVVNVTKKFGANYALRDVSLDVYRGELTVLLGHNGAGKTTLMSIMTGTMNTTSGQVFVNGQDMMKKQEARRQIGFCPQHNMFYPQLSVIEHVVLFSMLRGQTRSEAWKSSHLLLERLGLDTKASVLSAALSGGMKRRLQMACALAGSAAVVVLDEPSSGLDVHTRRALWDLVLSLRGERTVLVSTHFMEEADALGDRVAALHHGALRCHASPMYLKKAIGTGYRLTFTTLSQPNEAGITAAVRMFVPDATVKEVTLNSISFGLPAASSGAFPAMFASLETRRSELGVESIGVGASTLEEVFVRLCSDIDTTAMTQDEVDGVSDIEATYAVTTGPRLYVQQFCELLKRQAFYMWHKKYSFAIWQVIIPIAIIAVSGTQLVNPSLPENYAPSARRMDLGSYEAPGYRVMYRGAEPYVREVADRYPGVVFERVDDVYEDIMRIAKKDMMEYHKYLAGIEINDTNAKVLFTTTVRHAAPTALSLLANVLGAALAAPAPAPRVLAVNDPVSVAQPTWDRSLVPAKNSVFIYSFSFFVASVLAFNLINAAHLPIAERLSGARHLHIMTGCSPELHWAATLAARALVALLAYAAPVALVCACDRDSTLDEPVFLGAWFAVLCLGSMAILAFVFLVSLYFNQLGTNTLLTVCIFFNFVCFVISQTVTSGMWHALAVFSQHVFPPHALLSGLAHAATRAAGNAECALNRRLCPHPALRAGCCDTQGNLQCMFCYGTNDDPAPGYSMVILLFQLIIYMSLVFATQRGLISKLVERVKAARYTPRPHRFNDEMVRAEKAYVDKAIDLPPRQIQDVMLVSDLHKTHNLVFKPLTAIKGISFSVKKGECLGLLGVNGAGKSSAFRVLTGEDWPTRGRAFAAGYHRAGYSTDYMRGLGYCPQFLGVDGFLSGRRNLRLLLALRGLPARAAAADTASWIRLVGLEKYMDRPVEGYSGGCQRRLATAAALAVGAPLTLLDEPTAGVDVAARRRVWAALRRALSRERAVIITSHSMDEMEALCHRIAIMSAGEICALGSPSALRAAHAAGHALRLKLRPRPPSKRLLIDETDSTTTPLNQLKGTLREKFDCTLKDEHKTMLHYHINETLQYSKIFAELERLRSSFPDYVEDYSVTETTLEEVFLSFARDAPPEPQSEPAGRDHPEVPRMV